MIANILVVDDDETMRLGCQATLVQEGHRITLASNGEMALKLTRDESFDIVLLDLRMPGLNGMEVLARLRQESPNTMVLIITGYATIESAVTAMRSGAYDVIPKPFTPDILVAAVHRALERKQLALENACLRLSLKERLGPDPVVGQSSAMQQVNHLVHKAALTDATVLLLGETGVGKEIVARTIHQQSPRHKQPFVTVDCATLVENLFESELFGHVRGAFTGATETTNGKLELANGGTFFLDEIGNIGPEVQVKLLRVLQEREFMKVGGTQRIKVDVRVIAATNVDLLQAIREGTFREDLFYRISVIPISIPPLRERLQDIRLLVYHFFKKYGGRRNRQVKNFSDAALTVLEKYHWPGNVRELENTIERALVMAEGSTIEVDDLFFYGAPEMSNTADTNNAGQLAKVEQREIAAALEQFGWQMAKTAEYLGINRKTLREKMKRYGLSVPIRE